MHYKVPCEFKNQQAIAKRAFQIVKNGQDAIIKMGSDTKAPDRANTPS